MLAGRRKLQLELHANRDGALYTPNFCICHILEKGHRYAALIRLMSNRYTTVAITYLVTTDDLRSLPVRLKLSPSATAPLNTRS